MILVSESGLSAVGSNCLSSLKFKFISFLRFRLEAEEINELLIILVIALQDITFTAILTPY